MCSLPVQVKLQVSLQHNICRGELSRLEPVGYSICINVARSSQPDSLAATLLAVSNTTNAAA